MHQLLRSHFLILHFFNVLGLSLVLAQTQCADDQKTLLLQLKHELTYDSSVSTKLVQWNRRTDCCLWDGVICDAAGHVIHLDLSNDSISGVLKDTSSLFSLSFLQSLNLGKNGFDSYPIPDNFGKLTGLTYLNLSDAGFSGKIPIGLSRLTRLISLDLSSSQRYSNYLQLQNPNLEMLVQNLTSLQQLYLDGVNISAQGLDWGPWISSSLPHLQVMSLINCLLSGPLDSSLAKLKSLSVIRLDLNHFPEAIPEFFGEFSNLTVLSLGTCGFSGATPKKIFQLKSLQVIDLSNNRDLAGSLPEFPRNSSLQSLNLGYTMFSGNLPQSISNLGMLKILDLSSCNFTGAIPSSMTLLARLVNLDLSVNYFTGSLPSFHLLKNLTVMNLRRNNLTGLISSVQWGALGSLQVLDLSENSIEGQIPPTLFSLPSLEGLTLSYNRFSGLVGALSGKSLSPLEDLDISNNNIEGPVPDFLFELLNLTILSLSWNQFNGTIDLRKFEKLKNLVSLDLSYNRLTVDVRSSYSRSSFLPLFGTLMLASCNLKLVPFLKNQPNLRMLDLSNNEIGGEIPNFLWDAGDGALRSLNLSHNQFTHIEEPYSFPCLDFFDLHSNLFSGQLLSPPLCAVYLDYSSNNFSSLIPADLGNSLTSIQFFSVANNKIFGTIPESLCNATRLDALDLSNNSLHGIIPPCLLGNSSALGVLNLGRNNLSGNIPPTSDLECNLETLDLSWNLLEGQVPETLSNCSKLKVLNIGHNKLNGPFLCWISRLSNLRVLVLSHNGFHGSIDCPNANYSWSSLQLLDIASNDFGGHLPPALFAHLNAMAADSYGSNSTLDHLQFNVLFGSDFYYQDKATVILKGTETVLDKILYIFTSIDFSSNKFEGNLPGTIGDLKSLYLLNLSRNALVGQIPPSIGNLKRLESVDLSHNQLNGEIPDEIASVPFLSLLNVANNQLVGRIPKGNQIQTFPPTWFEENKGLCGFPLNVSCSLAGAPRPTSAVEEEEEFFHEAEVYASFSLGFVVSLLAFLGSLLYSMRWRIWYISHVDRLVSRILPPKQKGRTSKQEKEDNEINFDLFASFSEGQVVHSKQMMANSSMWNYVKLR